MATDASIRSIRVIEHELNASFPARPRNAHHPHFLELTPEFGHNRSVALLDDPIQNMDDYNVVGLLDMLRAFLPMRQLFISTHDNTIGDLIARKLRPSQPGGRAILHRLSGYNLDGPEVTSETLEFVEEPWIVSGIAS